MYNLTHQFAEIYHDLEAIYNTPYDQEIDKKLVNDVDQRIQKVMEKFGKELDERTQKLGKTITSYIRNMDTKTGIENRESLSLFLQDLRTQVDSLFGRIERIAKIDIHRVKVTMAFMDGDLPSLQKLLTQNPVDLNYCTINNVHLINLACRAGDLAAVKYLIKKNVDINSFDPTHWDSIFPAIVEACLSQKTHQMREILTLILSHGAKVDIQDRDKNYMLAKLIHKGAEQGKMTNVFSALRFFIEEGYLDIHNTDLFNALLKEAFEINSPQLVRLIAYSGANVQIPEAPQHEGIEAIEEPKERKELIEAFEVAVLRRNVEAHKFEKSKLVQLKELPIFPVLTSIVAGYSTEMETLTPEQRKIVIRRCLLQDAEQAKQKDAKKAAE